MQYSTASGMAEEICVDPRIGIAVTKRELYVSVLCSFQKLCYDQPMHEQAQEVCRFAQRNFDTTDRMWKIFCLVTDAFNNLKQVHACPFREILCCNCSKSSSFAHERPSLQQVRSSMCVYWR